MRTQAQIPLFQHNHKQGKVIDSIDEIIKAPGKCRKVAGISKNNSNKGVVSKTLCLILTGSNLS